MPQPRLKRKKGPGARIVHRSTRIITGGLLLMLAVTAVPVLALRWVDPPVSSFMLQYSAKARFGGNSGHVFHYDWVDWAQIAPEVKLAVIASEDQRFVRHIGFDLDAMYHAWREHRGGKSLRGASTITQQTAKNLFLWPSRSLMRKALEGYFSLLIELFWAKRRILEVYLNIAEFGEGIYGIGAAARAFFHKAPSELTLGEAALAAAALPSPRRYSVHKPSSHMLRRRNWIIKQMRQLGGTRHLGGL